MKTKLFLFALAAAAFSTCTAWAGGLDINITGEIRLGRRLPPPPPEVVVVVGDTGPAGPSPWEHGRWYQRPQGYYYYPGGDVYFRPSDRVWFYQERGQWRSGRNLPEYVVVDFNRSVSLSMATNRPYTFHQHVVARYPANYFDTRVRIRDEDRLDRDHGHDDRGHDRDNDRHDKGKDHNDRR